MLVAVFVGGAVFMLPVLGRYAVVCRCVFGVFECVFSSLRATTLAVHLFLLRDLSLRNQQPFTLLHMANQLRITHLLLLWIGVSLPVWKL